MEEMTLFDLLPKGQAEKYKPDQSTDWKWRFEDYPKEKNGIKVFSCFACGGGSTMGYKLAGCEVLGCVEIDPKMNDIYVKNHHPKYNFCMDLREFNALPQDKIPSELFDIDILDGSPPCTTFSTAGKREKTWGKKKKFREGQKEQTLDDLSFVFIDTVQKLRPKVVIMENVEGLLIGEAWSYVQEIYMRFKAAGYTVHHWLLKGETMGVPQTRHRVFFVAIRLDLWIDPQELDMTFNYEPVLYKDVAEGSAGDEITTPSIKELIPFVKEGDANFREACIRRWGRRSFFNEMVCYGNRVFPTIRGNPSYYRYGEWTRVPAIDYVKAATFPLDYDFGTNNVRGICYICGMSVPPVMMKRVVMRLIEQGVFDYVDKTM